MLGLPAVVDGEVVGGREFRVHCRRPKVCQGVQDIGEGGSLLGHGAHTPVRQRLQIADDVMHEPLAEHHPLGTCNGKHVLMFALADVGMLE